MRGFRYIVKIREGILDLGRRLNKFSEFGVEYGFWEISE